MKYIVEFSGKILVEANGENSVDREDSALYTLGQLTGDELLQAMTGDSVREASESEIEELKDDFYKAEDYV